MALPPPRKGPRQAWFYKGQLLVAQFVEGPGEVHPTATPPPGTTLPTCRFAHGKCLSQEWEPDVMRALQECRSFEDLLKRMKYYRYRTDLRGPPQHKRRPYYRL